MAISISAATARRAARATQNPAIHPVENHNARVLTGSQILCEALEAAGVEVMFGYPGGAIMPFYDALSASKMRHVLTRHEQAAAHAADGYARATGKVGVCVATSGPGATNLVTGIATAFADSVPMVAITGQVARRFIGTDAFQETDIIGITQPITKHSFLVTNIEELADTIHQAFQIAQSGRPGPVLVDVPKDILQGTAPAPEYHTPPTAERPSADADLFAAADRAADLIKTASRPLILAGHGVILANAYDELRDFAERTGIPVVTTLLGLSAFPESHPLAAGMPGMHGRAEVNHAITASDLLIAVGMRFDDRVTGDIPKFAPKAKVIHIDIDPSEMGKVIPATVPMVADAKVALSALIARVPVMTHGSWSDEVTSRCDERIPGQIFSDHEDMPSPNAIPSPAAVLGAIRYASNGQANIVSDVGQHQMWVARFYSYDKPNSHFSSGGLGTMGFALPAAMGVALGRPGEPVWVVAGDGGIQMNIQEMMTIMDLGLPIKVVVLNNGYLGMVRQWQEFFHQRNYSETRISSPDFVKLAEAYGATGFNVMAYGEIEETIKQAIQTEGPVIINVVIEQESNVFPMVAPGKAINDMLHRAPTRPTAAKSAQERK